MKKSTHKALLGAEKNLSKIEDDEWMDLDVLIR